MLLSYAINITCDNSKNSYSPVTLFPINYPIPNYPSIICEHMSFQNLLVFFIFVESHLAFLCSSASGPLYMDILVYMSLSPTNV